MSAVSIVRERSHDSALGVVREKVSPVSIHASYVPSLAGDHVDARQGDEREEVERAKGSGCGHRAFARREEWQRARATPLKNARVWEGSKIFL